MPVAYGTRNPIVCGSPDSGQNPDLRVAERLTRPLGSEWVRWGPNGYRSDKTYYGNRHVGL